MVGYSRSYFGQCSCLPYRVREGFDTGKRIFKSMSLRCMYMEKIIHSDIILRVNYMMFVQLQIGYEPIPPKPTVTLFGNPALKLPNAFTYSKFYFEIYLLFSHSALRIIKKS